MASTWGTSWGTSWANSWGTMGGGAGVPVTFFRGVSKAPTPGVSLTTHSLTSDGFGGWIITLDSGVAVDNTASPNYESFDT